MKPILQAEAAECGLASLAMVASAHGLHLGLLEMRRRFPLSLKGAKLGQLIHIAQQLGFQCRPVRLDMEDLDRLQLPCILHWNLDHFVVLTRVGKDVTVLDPACGERKYRMEEVSRMFSGVALELAPTSSFERKDPTPSASLRQLTGPIRGLSRGIMQVLLLSLALQIFVLLAPFYMQWTVDQVLSSADLDLLAVLGIGFGLSLLLQIAIGLLRGWSVVYLSSSLGLQWTGNVFAHLIRLPLEFFEKRNLGDVTSRISSVQAIQKTLTTNFVEVVIDGTMAAATFALMTVYSWKLALLTLSAVIVYLGIRAVSFRPLRDRTEQQLMAGARQQSHLLESLRGMQSLKVSGGESHRRATFQNLMHDTVNNDVRLAWMGLKFNSASQLVFGVERIAVVWVGALLALQNVFSVGMLVAYLAYKDQFSQRMGALVDKWVEFRMLRLHGERLADIVLSPPEADHALVGAQPPREARIEVENLSFRYAEGEPWVLKDCSFCIQPGESVAIVGASGCGKTTLVKLLLGLLAPVEGVIRVGGQDLQMVGPRTARSIMGAVMQDDQLFAGSISENISFFDPLHDPERIEAAARLASVHDDIVAMPMGYHSLIGDMGSALSGGQKQRVILARALYRRPQLLFLDEATSHLDVLKERLVNEAVSKLELTRVIVAHRPETIASADRVLVLDRGRIAQDLQAPGPPAAARGSSAVVPA